MALLDLIEKPIKAIAQNTTNTIDVIGDSLNAFTKTLTKKNAADVGKKFVATGAIDLFNKTPAPATFGEALKLGVKNRSDTLSKQFATENIEDTVMNFSPMGVANVTVKPIVQFSKPLVTRLVKEKAIPQIEKILKKGFDNLPEPLVREISPLLAKATKEVDIQKIINDGLQQFGAEGVSESALSKLINAVEESRPARAQTEAAYTAARSERAKAAADALSSKSGESAYFGALSKLKGELAPDAPLIGELRSKLTQPEVNKLFDSVRTSNLDTYDKLTTFSGLSRLLSGRPPREGEISLMEEVFGRDLVESILKNKTTLQKVREGLVEAINLPRALITSLDMSAPLRQGIVLTTTKPKQVPAAVKEMFAQAFSGKRFEGWLDTLYQDPSYQTMKKAGLYVADPRRISGGLSAKEEQFMTNLAEKIPFYGKLVGASQRAYLGYLNKLRVDVFTQLKGEFEKVGTATPENLKALADFVNTATGRGDLGKVAGRIAPELNAALFSPRLIASRVRMLNPAWYARMPATVRKEAVKSMLQFVGTGMTVLTLAKAAGAEVEIDPRSTDFGKIKVGNTRWDIWGGFQQWVRVASQLASGEKKTTTGQIQELSKEDFPFQTRFDTALLFGRGKLAPVPALALELLDGQKLYGGDVKAYEEIRDSIVPLYLQDIKTAIDESGPSALLTSGVPSFFGISTQTYKPTGTPANKLLQSYGVNTTGSPGEDILKKYGVEKNQKGAQDILNKYGLK